MAIPTITNTTTAIMCIQSISNHIYINIWLLVFDIAKIRNKIGICKHFGVFDFTF